MRIADIDGSIGRFPSSSLCLATVLSSGLRVLLLNNSSRVSVMKTVGRNHPFLFKWKSIAVPGLPARSCNPSRAKSKRRIRNRRRTRKLRPERSKLNDRRPRRSVSLMIPLNRLRKRRWSARPPQTRTAPTSSGTETKPRCQERLHRHHSLLELNNEDHRDNTRVCCQGG
jgi:hypothetical protein